MAASVFTQTDFNFKMHLSLALNVFCFVVVLLLLLSHLKSNEYLNTGDNGFAPKTEEMEEVSRSLLSISLLKSFCLFAEL